ncbi:hypothetical protein PQC11_gp006 [Synechococcus phage S-H9-1]|uniref:Uncharacterized protein n=1 Tax=Synechococcus phage S-H9-1 TaxID=2783674 RepID=A0A873WSK5_9CAUD|nr:hypothetical protein PQC11_gp006 [Synechococcus phage S-H9-1]QPB08054.1 hypothetical protein [Synechococcus phage S-H9-1]
MEHVLIFGFIILLTVTLEMTWPVKNGIKRFK